MRETNCEVYHWSDREGPCNGRSFKDKKRKANYDKGAVSCMVIAALVLLVQQPGP